MLDVVSATAFGCCMYPQEDLEVLSRLTERLQFQIPRILRTSINNAPSDFDYSGIQPITALKTLIALNFNNQKKSLSEQWGHEGRKNSAVSSYVQQRESCPIPNNLTVSNYPRTGVGHPLGLFLFLSSEEDLKKFQQSQEEVRLRYDEYILNGFQEKKPIEAIAKDLNTSSELLTGYIQSRVSLLKAGLIEVTFDTLNVVPFIHDIIHKPLAKTTQTATARQQIYERAAYKIRKTTSFSECVGGLVGNKIHEYATHFDLYCIQEKLVNAADKSLIRVVDLDPDKIKIADRHGARIAALEAAAKLPQGPTATEIAEALDQGINPEEKYKPKGFL